MKVKEEKKVRAYKARGYPMTEYLGRRKGKRGKRNRIALTGFIYALFMAGITLLYWLEADGTQNGLMMAACLGALAAAAVVSCQFFKGAGDGREALYQELAEFTDTVLFEYSYGSGNLHFTSNALGQMEPPAVWRALDKYIKDPPEPGIIECFEFRMRAAAEEYHWCICHVKTEYGRGSEPVRLIGKLDDISKQKKREEQLLLQSTRDGLTGVYNKTAFEYVMEETLKREHQGHLYMIDIDNFKEVNDQYGHSAGDKILIKIGELLREIFRDSDLIGRVGGDEFVVYSEHRDIEERASKLLCAISEFIPEEGQRISVSIGIAASTGKNGEGYRELFVRADRAMYRAKQDGKNRIAFYEEDW